jgi:hypothetical protein
MCRRRAVALAAALVLAGAGSARADRPSAPDPAVDDDFLEFLGSVDYDSSQAEDGWWIDYLSRTDPGKAKPAGGVAPGNGAKPPVPAKPSPAGDAQKNG